jgi:hypothetical protein
MAVIEKSRSPFTISSSITLPLKSFSWSFTSVLIRLVSTWRRKMKTIRIRWSFTASRNTRMKYKIPYDSFNYSQKAITVSYKTISASSKWIIILTICSPISSSCWTPTFKSKKKSTSLAWSRHSIPLQSSFKGHASIIK